MLSQNESVMKILKSFVMIAACFTAQANAALNINSDANLTGVKT